MLFDLVHFNTDKTAASIEITDTGAYSLSHTAEWTRSGFALSPNILLNTSSHDSTTIKNYLANLLPEGRGLEDIADKYSISKTNIAALVNIIGRDISGAFSIVASGENLADTKTAYTKITDEELASRIKDRAVKGLTFWDGKPRLSIAGVQDKLPVIYKDGEFGFGDGKLASTHILKFGTQKYTNLVLNEFVCLDVAGKMKLPVAKHQMLNIADERVLLIERFDREVLASKGEISKLHIIDGCQALNLSPERKYERYLGTESSVSHVHGSANFKNLFALSADGALPAVMIRDLLNIAIFNLLIGNSDAHAKNFSFFVRKDGLKLAPAYDLVDISRYENCNQEMAMKVGESFGFGEISSYDLALFCKECGIKPAFLEKRIYEATKSLESVVKNYNIKKLTIDSSEIVFVESMLEGFLHRSFVLRSNLELLSEIYYKDIGK